MISPQRTLQKLSGNLAHCWLTQMLMHLQVRPQVMHTRESSHKINAAV
jgi:hypothetical protein